MTSTINDWQSPLDALRNDFREHARSYPKLFCARLVGQVVTDAQWRLALGDKLFLKQSSYPLPNGSDQWCVYADIQADQIMCAHSLEQFEILCERAMVAIRGIPSELLGTLGLANFSNWLGFVDSCGTMPGQPDQIKGFSRDQFRILKNDSDPRKAILVPAIAVKASPDSFPPDAFPHVWLSVLSPDISTCSAAAIDGAIRRMPSPDSDFTITSWVDKDGSEVTWTVYDTDTENALRETYGEPKNFFQHTGRGFSGTALVSQLDAIPPGRENAHRYHQLMAQILNRLFSPQLTGMKIEQEINEGRKRIDICFDNVAVTGFFHDLMVRYGIPCPLIFVECKNYNNDPANPELDQLQGRFGKQRGRFGLLVCREISDRTVFVRRCRDMTQNDGYVIALTDEDVKSLWTLRGLNNEGFDQYLRDKLKELIL